MAVLRKVGVTNMPQNCVWSAMSVRMGPQTPRSKYRESRLSASAVLRGAPKGLILMIGKERRESIGTWLRDMAAAAIGFLRIIEQTIAAHFAVAEAGLAL